MKNQKQTYTKYVHYDDRWKFVINENLILEATIVPFNFQFFGKRTLTKKTNKGGRTMRKPLLKGGCFDDLCYNRIKKTIKNENFPFDKKTKKYIIQYVDKNFKYEKNERVIYIDELNYVFSIPIGVIGKSLFSFLIGHYVLKHKMKIWLYTVHPFDGYLIIPKRSGSYCFEPHSFIPYSINCYGYHLQKMFRVKDHELVTWSLI